MDNFSSLFGEDTLGGLGLDGLDTFGTSQPTATPVSVAEEPPSAFQPAPVSQGNYTSLGPSMQQLQSRKPGYAGPAAGFPGYGQPQPSSSASGAAAAGYQPYPTAAGPQPTPQQPVPYRQQQQGYPAGYQYPGQPHMWPGQQHFTPSIASPYGHPQQQQAYHPGMAGYSPQHLAAMQRASVPAQSQLPYPGGYQPRPTAAAAAPQQQQSDAQQYAAARQQQMYAAYRGYPQQQQAQLMARSDQQHAAYPGFSQQQQHYGAAPTPAAGYMTGQRMPRPGMASPQQQQPTPQQRLPGQQQQAVRMPSPQQMSPQVRHPAQLTAAAASTVQRQPSPVAPPSSLQHLEKMVMPGGGPAGRVLSPMAASSRSTPHSPSVVGPRTPTSPSSAAGWTQQLQRAPSPAPAAQLTAHQHHAVRMTSIDSMLHSMGPADGAAAAAAMRSESEAASTADATSSSQSSQHAGFMEVRDACSTAGAAGYGEMMLQQSPHGVMLPPAGGYQPQQQHMGYSGVSVQQQQMTQMPVCAQPPSLRPPQPHAAGWQHQQLQQQVLSQPLSVSAPAAPHPPATSRATEQPARMFSPAPPPNQSDSIAIPDVCSPGSDDQQSAASPSAPLPSMRTPQLPAAGPAAPSQISVSHHRMSGGGLVGMQQQASMSHPAPVPAFSMAAVGGIHHPAFMPRMRSPSHVATSAANPLSSGMHPAASVSAAAYTSTPAPVSSMSAPRSMLHSISSMVPSAGSSSPVPSPPRMPAPAPHVGSPMVAAFPSNHAAVSTGAGGSPVVVPLHYPAILPQSGPRHFPNVPDSQQTERTPSPRMSTGQLLTADGSVSPSTLVTSPVSSVSPSASSLASVHADHTVQSPRPASASGDSTDARLQSHRPQQRLACPADGGPAFPPFSAAAPVRLAAAPKLQSPVPPGSAIVRPGLSAAEESMPNSGGAAEASRTVAPSQSAHIQPHPGLPASALSAPPLPTSHQQSAMPPGSIHQQSAMPPGSIHQQPAMPPVSIHQQPFVPPVSIHQQQPSIPPVSIHQQQPSIPPVSIHQQQPSMPPVSIHQQPAMTPVSIHQQQPSIPPVSMQQPFIPPVSIQQQPSMPPVSIQQQPSMPPGSIQQQPSMPPGSIQQQPSMSSGPMQQQPSMPPGSIQQQPSMPPGSIQQQPSMSSGPMQRQPSMPPGSIQQQPSMPPGPIQQQPSMSSGPMQQQPSMPPGSIQQQPPMPPGPIQQQPSMPSGPMQQQPSMPPGSIQQHPGLPHQSPRMSAPYPQSGFHPQLQYPAVGPGHLFVGPPHHATAAMEQQRRGMQYELQQVQRQLQQLYSTPPTPQIQQSVQELQQRAQFLQMQLSVPPPAGHPGSFQGAPPPGYPAPGAPPGPLPPTQQPTVQSALVDPSAAASVLVGDDPAAAAAEDEPQTAGSGKRSRKKGAAKPRERKPPGEKKPRARSRSKKAAGGAEAAAAVDGAAAVPGADSMEAGEVLLQPGEVEPMTTDLPTDDVDQVAKTQTDAKPKRVRPPRSRKKPLPKAAAADEQTAGSEAAGEEGEAEDGEATAVPDEAAADGETPGSAKKPAKPRVRTATPSRRKPKARLALNLFKKKKRRRGSESEPSDMEKTPPPSPPEDDALNASKRRSGRITGGRKKYVDDLDLRQLAQISDDETTSGGGRRDAHAADQTAAQSFAPNFAFINPNDEDSMIVQYILGQRKGKREVIPDDEPDESSAVVTTPVAAPVSTDVPAPVSTDVPAPVSTDVPAPLSTDVPAPVSTDVPAPLSTDVPAPVSTDVPADASAVESADVPADVSAASVVETSESAAAVHGAAVEIKSEDETEADESAREEMDVSAREEMDVSGREEMDVSGREEMDVSGREEMDVSGREGMDVSGREESVAVLPGTSMDTADCTSAESQLPSTEMSDSPTNARVEPTAAGVESHAVETPTLAPTEPLKAPAADGRRREAQFIEVDEFYVKYKNFSYLHCEWRTEEELMRGDKRVSAKIKRYELKKRQSQNMLDFLEDELFNPDFVEVDRVLDVSEHTDPVAAAAGRAAPDKNRHFLVKWRSLSYEDCTWELEEDVDIPKIEAFFKYRHPPPKEQRTPKRRPKPADWMKMETCPLYKGNNQLREYQLEGVNWLTFSYYNGHNCILADEMGLGKTIQALTFAKAVFDCGVRGPFLVIAPLSTIPNWQREFEGWTDLNIIVYHGSAASRNMITEHEMYYKDPESGQQLPDVYKFHVLITTYEVIIQDCIELAEIGWRLCIIDEAHRLKNANCKLLEGLRLLDVEHRVLLSGTPLQNNIRELFSLLNFLEPTQFSSEDAFNREFGLLQTDEQVKKLQALLKPMMLRRLKEDVEKSLAPKEETIIEVELTNIQKKYYRGILEKNFAFLAKGSGGANLPNLMNTMMELRKCCIHPFLINGAEEQIQHERRQENKEQGNSPDTADEAYYQAMVQSAGKLVLVDKLLPKLRSQGHRVLVFSQMVRMLDILEDYLIYKQYPFERIDGRIRGDLRQAAIDRYSRPDSDRFVFLLCTKAGGLGINLTAADTVIIYDSDWNPQNDLQAQARCHRIGQRKMVKVYRLVTRNTYEREMFDRASLKLGLDKAVLQSMNTQQGDKSAAVLDGAAAQSANKQLTKKEVEVLLKKGAYGALMDDDTDGQRFCEEDIDQILEKRTQVITIEEEKGSNFSKASFSTAGNRSDIDVDDPDFWNKWAKRAEITQEDPLQNTLIVAEPRRRARIKRYGEETAPLDMSDIGTSSDSDEEAAQQQQPAPGKHDDPRGRRRRAPRYRADDDMDFISTDGSVGYGSWSRIECFKVERQLLVFGWGRWADIRLHGQLRDGWTDTLVEDLCRLMLLQCVRVYKGDDKIRSFVFDLICPENQGIDSVGKNHMGLNAPVPRGRKGKKKSRPSGSGGACDDVDWSRDRRYDTEQLLDRSYHRHLIRHANKLLLRVRMMYYVRTEIIGPLADRILDGATSSELGLHTPYLDQPPAVWWDSEADRALLMGTYKHGYERYVQMRQDPALCFLQRCGGPPSCDITGSSSAPGVSAPNDPDTDTDIVDDDLDREDTASSSAVASPAPSSDTASTPAPSTPSEPPPIVADGGALLFPSTVDLNTRLRRLVTAYQRTYKREEQKLQAQARRNERREKIEQIVREREMRKLELTQRRWSRQDEANFLRVLAAFGVEYRRKESRYEWSRFRMLARLEKKLDDTLTDYYVEFRALCQQVCAAAAGDSQPSTNSAAVQQPQMSTITELIPATQAAYLLDRLDLLNALRNEVVMHAELEDRLKLCEDAPNLPDWWTSGKHDRDLIIGAVRHGIGNSGFYILHDPDLSFRDVVTRHMKGLKLVDRKEKLKYAEWRQSRPAASDDDALNNGVNGALPNGHVGSEAAGGDATVQTSSPPPPGTPPGNTHKADTGRPSSLGAVHQQDADSVEVKCNGDVSSNGGTTTPTADISQSTRAGNGDASDVCTVAPKRHSSGDQVDDQQESVDEGRTEDESPVPIGGGVKQDPVDDEMKEDQSPDLVEGAVKQDSVDGERKEDGSPDLVEGAVKQDSVGEGRVKDESPLPVDRAVKQESVDEGTVNDELPLPVDGAVKQESVDEVMVNDESPLPVDRAVKQVSNDNVAASVKSELNVKREADCEPQKQDAVRLVNSASAQLFGTEESLGGRLSQLYDAEVLQELAMIQMLHQSYAAPIRWPSDHVLHQRLQQVLAAVRTGSWPPVDYQQLPADPLDPALVAGVAAATTAVGRTDDGAVTVSTTTRASTSRRVSSAAAAAAVAVYGQPSEQLVDDAATVATAGGERRGRKRAATSSGMEVDSERTKLRALLNQNLQSITRHPSPQQPPRRTPTTTDTAETDSDGLAAVPPPSISPSQQPPPAHQHLTLRGAPPPGGIDLSFKTPQQQLPTAAPPASSPRAATPTAARADDVLDLSASLNSRSSTPQSERAAEDGALDLHMSRTSSAVNPPTRPPSAGGRLDATPLDVSRKRPSEEVGGKVKKRRKLDSIISGLSAAKTSSPVSGDMTPSVSITPVPRRTAAPQPPPAHAAASALRHDDAYPDITLSRAAQRRHDTPLLAAAAAGPSPLPAHDMHKPDNKVYNWLETQHKASPSGSSARSRQRSDSSCSSAVSPSGRLSAALDTAAAVDWSKLSPDAPVPVVNRFTGKRLSGTSAPQLKNLAQWLLENPMFDVDPHWSVPKSSGSGGKSERRKGPGRPPMSPPSAGASSSRASQPNKQHDSKHPLYGMDPKNLLYGMDPKMMAAYGLDPRLLQMDPKLMASMGLDPKMMASMGLDSKMMASMGMDPKMMASMGLDPKMMASMGLDPKMMASMGLDPKMMASMGLDPKMMASMGLDSKSMAAMGLDPKVMTSLGLDPKMMASMGMDPKAMASMGFDPRMMTAMGLDPKMMAAMGLDPKMMASMGLDPKMMASMGLDPKVLASMGLDPKMMSAMGMDPKTLSSMGVDPKMMAAMGLDPKAMASMGIDPKYMNAMGLDHKAMASAMGLDQKTLAAMGLDQKTMASMGMDPKNMASMGLDPKMVAAMGLDPKMLASMGLDPKLMQSMGIDPKALAAMSDPKMLAAMGLDPKMMASLSMDPKMLASLGMDPKMMASMGMDPKSIAAMGLDPKSLALMSGLDPKMNPLAGSSIDPKTLSQLDPKMLSSLGMDPKTLSMMGGMDPRLLAMDPRTSAALAGLDPKMLAQMDPALLCSLGIDPKLLQALSSSASAAASSGGRASTTSTSPARSTSAKSKSSSSAHRTFSTSSATAAASAAAVTSSAAITSSAAGLYGLDPALLQGLDPRALAAMDPRANPFMLGLDPKTNPYLAAGLDPKHNPFLAGLDPKHPLYGIDPKMLGIDMKSPLMYGGMTLPGMYPGLSLPGLTSAGTTSSLAAAVSSSSRKHAASSPVSLYGAPTSSIYGAAGAYSPMAGWGGAALYNGGGTATVSSTRTKPTASSTVTSDEAAGGGSDRRAAEREKIRSLLKDKVDIKGGLTKEQRNLLKERKRERLMKEQDGVGVDLRGAREQLEAAERLAREMEREQRTRDRELDAKERQLAEAQAALLAETAAAGTEEVAPRQPLDLPPAAVEATSERPASTTPPAVSEPPLPVDHEPSTA